jgi:hypothetical protein
MKIRYNKNEVIAAARFVLEKKPSSKMPSHIHHTDRGYLPERGEVDEILKNIRSLAKANRETFEAIQQTPATGDAIVNPLSQKWIEVLGVGGYWIIANIEGSTINFSIAVSPWFGDYLSIDEEI